MNARPAAGLLGAVFVLLAGTSAAPEGNGIVGSLSPAGTVAPTSSRGGQAGDSRGDASIEEPAEARLLRTPQIGSPQGITVDEILAFAHGNQADYTGHLLARAALTVLGEDRGFPDWPLARLLQRTLTQLQDGPTPAYGLPDGLPGGFRGEHLVLATVYALVVSGQQRQAIDVLEAQLASGSKFKRGVILQALRTIGSDRATGIVQQAADDASDSLPANLLADHYYPFLQELREHWDLVPLEQRDRASLTALAGRDCGRPASVAAYLLGFLAPAADSTRQQAELDVLRRVSRSGRGCFYNRFFAIRSLALRSPETVDTWVDLYRREEDAWQRAQLVRIGFARFGREFLDTALELLATEPVQYVQWELMHGNIEVREGATWRTYWDLWLTPTLQFRLDFSEGSSGMASADLDALLSWLESGARPQHPWVRNHMLHGMARHIDGDSTRRFLRIFDAHADKAANWWILSPLQDPVALPLLRYWATLDTDEQQRAELERNIRGMEARLRDSSPRTGTGPTASCCEPTRACLLTTVESSAGDASIGSVAANASVVIATEQQAQDWLRAEPAELTATAAPEIAFLDELERIAIVSWPGRDRRKRWEFLFGCWRRVPDR